jgi:hypothetical protein
MRDREKDVSHKIIVQIPSDAEHAVWKEKRRSGV